MRPSGLPPQQVLDDAAKDLELPARVVEGMRKLDERDMRILLELIARMAEK